MTLGFRDPDTPTESWFWAFIHEEMTLCPPNIDNILPASLRDYGEKLRVHANTCYRLARELEKETLAKTKETGV